MGLAALFALRAVRRATVAMTSNVARARLDFLRNHLDRGGPRAVLSLELWLHSHRSADSPEKWLLRWRSTGCFLRNVQSVRVEFPVLGRLFNYGALTVQGFRGSLDSIKRVPKPERVRELIEDRQPMSSSVHSNWRRAGAS
jgi:hypothetical protein